MYMAILNLWYKIRESFWPIPFLMCLVSIALSLLFVWLDYHHLSDLDQYRGKDSWLFLLDPEGTRSLLSTIASSTIGVAGVTFSITMVVLTLASSQFGPRLVRSFMKNLGNQITLGVFVSTFLYSILTLRFIQTGSDAFVPHLAVNFALLLTIASLAILIYFFHSVATQIQAESVIHLVSNDLKNSINRLFPKKQKDSDSSDETSKKLPSDFKEKSIAIKIKKSGHIQTIDYNSLLELAERQDLILKMNYRAGHYLHKHKSVLYIYGTDKLEENIIAKTSEAFTVGNKPTLTQDIEFPINHLVEIAVRALSPGINDPFTAMQCIDALTSGLSTLAARPPPSNVYRDDAGNIRLVLNAASFVGILGSAFNQIRQNTHSTVSVRIRLLDSLAQIAEEAVRAEDKTELLHHGEMIYEGSKKEGVFEPADQEDILKRFELLKLVLKGTADPAAVST